MRLLSMFVRVGVIKLPPFPYTMAALRLVRTASRRAVRLPLGRRGYAEATDKITFSMVLPYQVTAGIVSTANYWTHIGHPVTV